MSYGARAVPVVPAVPDNERSALNRWAYATNVPLCRFPGMLKYAYMQQRRTPHKSPIYARFDGTP